MEQQKEEGSSGKEPDQDQAGNERHSQQQAPSAVAAKALEPSHLVAMIELNVSEEKREETRKKKGRRVRIQEDEEENREERRKMASRS